jgi:hypothetical protein
MELKFHDRVCPILVFTHHISSSSELNCVLVTAGRQLRLLCCTPDEIMPFCMEVIIRTLKDVAFGDPKNERALGQLLVLLQYQWPKEEEIFASLITTIQKRRRFHFPEFFDYVIRIHLDPAIIGERSEPP